jgi:5-bromo-4-chloroindolyl phosphate hydrolysis protein
MLAEVKKAETKLKNSLEEFINDVNLQDGDLKIIRTQLKIISNDLRNIEKLQAEYSDKLGIHY